MHNQIKLYITVFFFVGLAMMFALIKIENNELDKLINVNYSDSLNVKIKTVEINHAILVINKKYKILNNFEKNNEIFYFKPQELDSIAKMKNSDSLDFYFKNLIMIRVREKYE